MVARPVHQLIGKRNEGAWEAHSDLTSHLGHVPTKSLLSDGRSRRKMGNKSLPGALGGCASQQAQSSVFLGRSSLCGHPGDNDSRRATAWASSHVLAVWLGAVTLGLCLGEACSGQWACCRPTSRLVCLLRAWLPKVLPIISIPDSVIISRSS